MKIGDKFVFDIGKMSKHNIYIDDEYFGIQTVLFTEHEKDLGEIITFKNNPTAQVNSCWVILVK